MVTSPLLRSQLLNLNGPVPVGCSSAYWEYVIASSLPDRLSASYFLSAVGLCMENDGSASAAGNLLVTWVILTTAVESSVALQLSYRLGVSGVSAKPPKTAW